MWLGHYFQGQKVKGQLAGGGCILWRPPAQLVIAVIIVVIHSSVGHLSLRIGDYDDSSLAQHLQEFVLRDPSLQVYSLTHPDHCCFSPPIHCLLGCPWHDLRSSNTFSAYWPERVFFPFSALTLFIGRREGHPVCKKLGVGLSVVTIWLEPCTSYSSTCHHTTSIIVLSSSFIAYSTGALLCPQCAASRHE